MLSRNATSSHTHKILMIFSDHDSDNGNLKIMETENTPPKQSSLRHDPLVEIGALVPSTITSILGIFVVTLLQ